MVYLFDIIICKLSLKFWLKSRYFNSLKKLE
jgi:hypothetical protein